MNLFSHPEHVGVRVRVGHLDGTATMVVGAGATADEVARAVASYVPGSHRLVAASTSELDGATTFEWRP
jgi:hypothetical protein